jgi:hypothetical protein
MTILFDSDRRLIPDWRPLEYAHRTLPVGRLAPCTAIYRCQECGVGVLVKAGDPLPTQEQHEHAKSPSANPWQILLAG